MQQTQNYKLNKPDYSDGADIAVLNENMDVLDGELIKKIQSDKPVNMTAPITAGGAQDLIVKQVRNMVISSGTPSGGLHGDVWLKYEPSASDDRTWKKYDCATVPCVTCTGTGNVQVSCPKTQVSGSHNCSNCGGDGSLESTRYNWNCNSCGQGGVSVPNSVSTCPSCGGSVTCESRPTSSQCGSCGGDGRIDDYVTCTSCNGAGKKDASCTVCNGTGNSIGKGTFVADITAAANSYPSNGRHTDGFWYVIVPIA